MKEKLMNDLKEAMRSQDKQLLTTLRMVKGAVQLEEINLKRELNDEEMISIFSKQIKTRKEANAEFEKGNRQDLIDQNNQEIAILTKYMPEQLSEEEVNKIIDEVFLEMGTVSATDMGKIMGKVTPLVKGKADMGYVSKTIKNRLN